ncbi:MAG: hypothetical protein EG824_02360 [Deltaproteobacteria bacterium]|nr:hypothetical protein [Deltaproteobacteria bacterium]
MDRIKSLLLVVAVCIMGSMIVGCQAPPVKSEVMAPVGKTLTVGEKARLFHSGSEDIKKVFCIGDVIPVSKETVAYGVMKRTEVGKVKVVAYEGNQAIIAEVVDGTVKAGNIAEKDATACMVYVPDSE